MHAYISALYKKLADLNEKQNNSIFSSETIYKPNTRNLSDKVREWIFNLDKERENNEFYEIDLCSMFKCKKEELAIASIDIPLYSKIKIRSYSINKPDIETIELNDIETFLFKCLQRGYMFHRESNWELVVNSKKLYDLFLGSNEYKGSSRAMFGKTIAKIGLARSILYGNPPNRYRAFKFNTLDKSRKIFSDNVLNNINYKWE